MKISKPFKKRLIEFKQIITIDHKNFKSYCINYQNQSIDFAKHLSIINKAIDALKNNQSFQASELGFIILHQGAQLDYLVICYWHNENECVAKVFVKQPNTANEWQQASNDESFCVWDLEVMWFEREAYVKYILSYPENPNIQNYLAAIFNSEDKKGSPH